jgi:hypothetical protein
MPASPSIQITVPSPAAEGLKSSTENRKLRLTANPPRGTKPATCR